MKILVIEDEAHVLEVLRRGLQEANYEVETAADGEVGLNLALAGGYDLILLDVNLPKLSGLELCAKLRERDELTPVLMLTALGMSDDVVAGLDHRPPPLLLAELLSSLSPVNE